MRARQIGWPKKRTYFYLFCHTFKRRFPNTHTDTPPVHHVSQPFTRRVRQYTRTQWEAEHVPSRCRPSRLLAQVTAKKLVWDQLDRDGGVAELLSSRPGGFDLVVASDCLFFKARGGGVHTESSDSGMDSSGTYDARPDWLLRRCYVCLLTCILAASTFVLCVSCMARSKGQNRVDHLLVTRRTRGDVGGKRAVT